jgi:serine/threonine-protein kinase PknK
VAGLIEDLLVEGASGEAWFARLDSELPTLREELERTASDSRRGLQIAAAVWPYWVARGMLSEGRSLLTRLLAAAPVEPTPARGRALCGAGMLAFLQGEQDAARAFQAESLEIAHLLDDRVLEADALLGLARVETLAPDPVAMERRARASVTAGLAAGDEGRVATALHHVAEALRRQGKCDEALPVYADALARHRAIGDRRSVTLELHNLSRATRSAGDAEAALNQLRESLRIAIEIRHERLVGYCLLDYAEIEAGRGAFEAAARLIGASDARFEAVGAARDPEYEQARERTHRSLQAVLGDDALLLQCAAGHACSLADSALLTRTSSDAGQIVSATAPPRPATARASAAPASSSENEPPSSNPNRPAATS